jgi:hypothetical protein
MDFLAKLKELDARKTEVSRTAMAILAGVDGRMAGHVELFGAVCDAAKKMTDLLDIYSDLRTLAIQESIDAVRLKQHILDCLSRPVFSGDNDLNIQTLRLELMNILKESV